METMEIPDENYRRYHESYMHSINGTTATETCFIIAPVCFNILTCMAVIYFIIPNITKVQRFAIEFCMIVAPTIVFTTIAADHLDKVLPISVGAFLTVMVYILSSSKPDFKNIKFDSQRNFVTNVRAVINIFTGVSILAVDFQIFPRRFAKTETFGFSLMDLGVGTYVFSNAVVTAVNQNRSSGNFVEQTFKNFLGCIPLFALGSIRFLVTNELEYQQQVSEYGVHWNFFITLAYTKFLSTLILNLISVKFWPILTLSLCLFHEYTLQMGLQDWVMSNIRRDTFLTANREGLVSSLGYVALYFVAMQVAIFVKFKQCYNLKSNIILISKIFVIMILSLTLTITLNYKFGVSRRLANFGYVAWVTFVAMAMVLIVLIGEIILMAFKKVDMKLIILEAINFNGLTFFLIANLLTGVVNLSIHTLNVSSMNSLLILVSYMLIVCSIMTIVYSYKIKLKCW